jgi:hypothetical protein
VPVEEVPWVAPVDGLEELDPVELVEPDCVLDPELLDAEPDWVESVPVEDCVPLVGVVDVVDDDASVPPAAVVPVEPAGSLGAAPPRLSVVEIPPVAADVTLTTVVVGVDLARVFSEVDADEGVCGGVPDSAASSECVAGLATGTDTWGAALL